MKKRRDSLVASEERRQARVEVLEQRVLFSADIMPGLVPGEDPTDTSGDHVLSSDELWPPGLPATPEVTVPALSGNAENQLVPSDYPHALESSLAEDSLLTQPLAAQPESVLDSSSSDTSAGGADMTEVAPSSVIESTEVIEVVYIDSRVEDYQTLIKDLQRQDRSVRFEVILIDATEDGLHKVSESLEALGHVNAIHLISHGSDGSVQLGATTLNAALLEVRGDELVDWSDFLSVGADFLIYGCDLAATGTGIDLIKQLAGLCQCDVAASDDKTGSSVLGADWTLEYVSGNVETGIAISATAQQQWQHRLDITSNLVAHFEFEEGTSTAAADSSVTGNHGWLRSPTLWTSDSAVGNYALDFTVDGVGNNMWLFADDNVAYDFGASDFTVSFWMKSSAVPAVPIDVVSQSTGGLDGFRFYTDSSGSMNFAVNGGSIGVSGALDGSWRLVTGVKTGGVLDLYIDDIRRGISSTSGEVGSVLQLRVGATGNNLDDFEGLIDDLRIYNRALSASDIAELYGAPAAANTSPTVTGFENSPLYVENSPPVVVDSDVQVADVELDALNGGLGNYSGASLSLARLGGENSEDLFSFTNGNGLSHFLSANLLKNSSIIGSFDWSPGHISLTFTDANGEIPTTADVQNFIQQISYQNSSEAPPPSVDLQLTLSDGNSGGQGSGGVLSVSDTITISINDVNDLPNIDSLHGDHLQVENDGASKTIDVAVPVAIDDIDNADFDNGFLRITGGGFDTSDQLEIVSGLVTLSSGVTNGSVVSVSGVAIGSISGVSQDSLQVDFNSDATGARVEALLNAVAINSTSTDYGYRTVNFTLNDGDGGSDSATADVVVVSSIPGTITTQEDVDYVFSAADFSIAGAVGSNLREVTFTALPSVGTLSISGVPVALNQSISKSSIDAGELIYRPAANDIGSAVSDIRFFVNSGKHAITILPGEPGDYTLGGTRYADFDASLETASNFGNNGTYPARVLVASAETDIDSSYLANGDILFVSFVPDGDLSSGELAAIDLWVNNGGVLIASSDASDYDPVSSYYGLPASGGGQNIWSIVDSTHPVIDGLFGLVGDVGDTLFGVGAIGNFSRADMLPGDIELAKDSASDEPTIILRQVGDGWIMLTADEGIFRGNISTANDLFSLNTIAWAADNVSPDIYTLNIDVVAANDQPLLSGVEAGALTYTENSAAQVVSTSIQVSDVDDTLIESATVAISANYTAEDILSFTDTPNITGTWDALSGTLTLTGSDTVANYQAALRSVTYENNSELPSTLPRSVIYVVNDGELSSAQQVRAINVVSVNDKPVISGVEASNYDYIENVGAVAVSASLSIADADDALLESASVNITSSTYIEGEGILAFVDTPNISSSWDAGSGILTLTGTDTVANYQAALRSVTYENTLEDPSEGSLDVMFFVNDGDSDSNKPTRTVEIYAINDVPASSNLEITAAVFTEGNPPLPISGAVEFSDADNDEFVGAVIKIGTNYVAGDDLLGFTDTANITAMWDAVAGELTLSGPDSIANYEAAVRAVTYQNISENPQSLPRLVSITVDDGSATSVLVTREIMVQPVNDPPVTENVETNVLTYVEGDGPVIVTDTISVGDVDDVNIETAEITIADNYRSSEDFLSFSNTGTITGVWNSLTGVLTLNGSDTVANYELALRSVTYENTSSLPSEVSRRIDFTVSDGDAESIAGSRQVDVVSFNTAPVIASVESSPVSYLENDDVSAVTTLVTLSDQDDSHLESAGIRIAGSYNAAEDILRFTDTVNISSSWDSDAGILTLSGTDTVAAYQAALRNVVYENTSDAPSISTRTIEIAVFDGEKLSNSASRLFEISAVNDPPVLGNIEPVALSTIENAAPVTVSDAITITDLDSTAMSSAVVRFASGYMPGEDILSFTGTATISGSWDAATGTLSLSGTDTPAAYQAALRSVTYENQSEKPTQSNRLVEFIVNDTQDSSNGVNREISVTPVNDPPQLSAVESAPLAYTENDGAVPVTTGIVVSDIDHVSIQSAVVSIAGGYNPAQDRLTYSGGGTITGVWDSASGTLQLSGSADAADYQVALRSLEFENSSEHPANTARRIDFVINDGADNSNVQSRNIDLTAINDAPVTSAVEADPLVYVENSGALTVTSTLTVEDVDDSHLESAIVAFSSGYIAGEDQLEFTNTATISGTWDAVSGTLTLTGSDTVANYQAALRSVTYQNHSEFPVPAPRTIDLSVNDGGVDSVIESRVINVDSVNDVPLIESVEPDPLLYAENNPAAAISSTLTVNDIDDATLLSARVSIVGGYIAGEDTLQFSDTTNITGLWDSASGVLTLTGTDTVANYQVALRSVSYANSSDNPSLVPRTVSFQISDNTDVSVAKSRTIELTGINDAPVAAVIEPDALIYTENDGATAVTETLTISDADDTLLEFAVISINSGYLASEDRLLFTDTPALAGNWDSVSGTLTIVGQDTVQNYQAALRSVSYQNSSEAPASSDRTVSFLVSDGEFNSIALDRNIYVVPVNDAPVVMAIEADSHTVVENSAPVVVSPALELTDDSGMLSSATVHVAGNYNADEDLLVYTGTSSLSSQWDSATGVLTLSGAESVAVYQAAMRQVAYQNLSENPSTDGRLIEFTVNDGEADSVSQQRLINVVAANDAPVVASVEIIPANYLENSTVAVTSDVSFSDPDNSTLQYATVTIAGNYVSGEDVLRFDNTPGISGNWDAGSGTLTLTGEDSIENYQVAIRSVTYQNLSDAPSDIPRTLTIEVGDGESVSNAQSREVFVEPVSDRPQLTGMEPDPVLYTEGGAAVKITSQLAVTDVDSINLQGATITISDNYAVGEDMLEFNEIAGISGFWDAAVGQLFLTGEASVTDYENALRSITYRNVSEHPSTEARSVTVILTDGDLESVPVSRTLMLTAVNDAPVVSLNSDIPVLYVENDSGTPVLPFAVVTDVDNTEIQSATVQVVSGYVPGEDYLQITAIDGINTVWDPVSGALQLSGAASVADYEQALQSVVYVNASDNPDTNGRLIGVAVSDGTADSNSAQQQISIVSVNDAPVGRNAAINIAEDTPYTFSIADFQFSDIPEGHTFTAVHITADPVAGSLLLNNQSVDAGTYVSTADISSGALTYLPPLNINGQAADTLLFKVQDSGGTSSNGIDTDVVARQMVFNIDAVNDAPFGTDSAVAGIEDTPVVITVADLGFTDPSDGHVLASIGLSTLPARGELYLSGVPVQQNAIVSVSDIASGNFVYVPAPDGFGSGYASFEFAVIDNGGLTNSGQNTAITTNTLTIDLTAVNDAPVLVTRTVVLPEGSEQVLDTDSLNGIDVDNMQPLELNFTLTGAPQNGLLLLAGEALAPQQSFSLADIINGSVSYLHDGSETSSDTVGLSLIDSGVDGTLAVPGILAVVVQEVIDAAPVVENDSLQLSFGEVFESSAGDVLSSGLSTVGGSDLQNSGTTLTLEQGPRNGILELSSDGTFLYRHNGSAVLTDEFSYRLTNDDGVFSIAIVEILIEPPIASAFAPGNIIEIAIPQVEEPGSEPEASEVVGNETAESSSETETDLTDAIAFSVSPFDAEADELTDDEALRPVVTLDAVEVETGSLSVAPGLIVVKQHNETAAPLTFVNSGAGIIDSLEFEIDLGEYRYGISNPTFLEGLVQLDSDLGDAVSESDNRIQLANEAVFGITISATAGVVAWIIRGGALFASVMAVTPLWASMDPGKLVGAGGRTAEDEMSEEVERYFESG